MSTYMLLLYQEGGCDYTIGCGYKWVFLRARSIDEARHEAKSRVLEYTEDQQLAQAILLEVSTNIDLPIDIWYGELEKEKEDEQRERDEKEFERLRKKLKK